MAFKLAEAYVQLSSKGYGTLSSAINGVRGQLGSLVSFATGPLGVALAGVGAGASVAGMVGMAAQAEQLEVAFGTMLGSADAAKAMIADLTKFAGSTPFEMPGITQAARSLMAFGVEGEQVLPLLRVLGDVSAGTGKDLSELSVIFGQISATGKLTGGDLMQLTNAGVPMLKTLAEQLGKTTGEVKQMVENGDISSADVVSAFQAMSAEGGLFANMMEKQSGTLAGLWSSLTDSVSQSLTMIGQAIVDGFDLKSAVANLQSFVDMVRTDWLPSVVAGFQWMRTSVITPFASWVGSMASMMFDFARDIDLYWEYAYTSIANWINNIWQTFSTHMSNLWTVGKWFFENFANIAFNVFSNIPKLFRNVVDQIRNNFQSLLNFFTTGELKFDWSPMVDSFNLAVGELALPKLDAPQLDALQGDLDNIASRLAQRQAARDKDRKKAAADAKDDAKAELDLDKFQSKEAKKQTEEAEKQADAQRGIMSLSALADKFQEASLNRAKGKGKANKAIGADAIPGMQATLGQTAAAAILAGAGGTMAQAGIGTAQAASVSAQNKAIESLVAMAAGKGIRVVMAATGGVQVPASVVQFGGTGA